MLVLIRQQCIMTLSTYTAMLRTSIPRCHWRVLLRLALGAVALQLYCAPVRVLEHSGHRRRYSHNHEHEQKRSEFEDVLFLRMWLAFAVTLYALCGVISKQVVLGTYACKCAHVHVCVMYGACSVDARTHAHTETCLLYWRCVETYSHSCDAAGCCLWIVHDKPLVVSLLHALIHFARSVSDAPSVVPSHSSSSPSSSSLSLQLLSIGRYWRTSTFEACAYEYGALLSFALLLRYVLFPPPSALATFQRHRCVCVYLSVHVSVSVRTMRLLLQRLRLCLLLLRMAAPQHKTPGSDTLTHTHSCPCSCRLDDCSRNLKAFFAQHDREFVPLVDRLLEEYTGHERLLYARIRRLYCAHTSSGTDSSDSNSSSSTTSSSSKSHTADTAHDATPLYVSTTTTANATATAKAAQLLTP